MGEGCRGPRGRWGCAHCIFMHLITHFSMLKCNSSFVTAHTKYAHTHTHMQDACMHMRCREGRGGRGDVEIDRAANGFHMSSLAGVDKWSMRHVSCHARHPLSLPPPTSLPSLIAACPQLPIQSDSHAVFVCVCVMPCLSKRKLSDVHVAYA